jgi:anti-sigma B factor antagonist
METSIRRTLDDDGTVVVAVAGEIDFTNADDVARCIEEAVTEWQPPLVRVDLRHAAFIDSTGLGALITGYRAATECDVAFTVVNASAGFQRVLAVTGLCELFGPAVADESDIAI